MTSARSALLTFGPHAGAHRVALRAGFSVAVPLLAVALLGHVEWSIYAAFGAFTSLYGRHHAHLPRARLQATLAVALTGAVVLGVVVGMSAHRSWLAVPVTAAVAGIGSLASDLQQWHPPGPLFLVFGVAATASVPSTASDVPVAFAVAGGAALLAVAVGALGGLRSAAPRGVPPSPPRASGIGRHVARNVVAVLLAGSLATASGVGHPYWAMVSAVVPLAARHLGPQIVRGVHRVVGTTLGLGLAALLLAVDMGTLGLVVVVVLLQIGAELLVGRNYALALVVITPLALLMVHLAAPIPAHVLMVDRWVETLIGALVGVGVGLVTRDRAQIS